MEDRGLSDYTNIRDVPTQEEKGGEEAPNWCSVPEPPLTNFKVHFKLYDYVVFGLYGLEINH